MRAAYIWERKKNTAENAALQAANALNGDASGNPYQLANASDVLNDFNISASYIYDRKYSFTAGYFNTWGTTDASLYGTANGSPDSRYWKFDLAYLPFMNGGPDMWPWFNARIGIQYTHFDKFDGTWNNVDGNSWPEGRRQRPGLPLHLADVLAQKDTKKPPVRTRRNEKRIWGRSLEHEDRRFKSSSCRRRSWRSSCRPWSMQRMWTKNSDIAATATAGTTKGSSDTTSLPGSPGSRPSILKTSSGNRQAHAQRPQCQAVHVAGADARRSDTVAEDCKAA